MISTLIVEDDFRVARLHAEVVSQVDGFAVCGVVHTASAALDAASNKHPQLVLLDLYCPTRTASRCCAGCGRPRSRPTSSCSAPHATW